MRTNRFLQVQAGRLLIVEAAFCLLLAVTGGSVQAHVEEVSESSPSSPSTLSHQSSPEGAGFQLASLVLTVPYGAVKLACAIGGSFIGGLAWAMTGGNMEVANSIWIPSMTGDYTVRPQHLTGEDYLYFVGVSAEEPPS
jgi:hypothetical protein